MEETIKLKFQELKTKFEDDTKNLGIEYAQYLIDTSSINVGDIVETNWGEKYKVEKFVKRYSSSDPSKSTFSMACLKLKKDGSERKKKEIETIYPKQLIIN